MLILRYCHAFASWPFYWQHQAISIKLCASSAFKKWQKLFGTIVQTSKVDKQCIFCTTGTGFHAMNLTVSIAGQNIDLWRFLWQHNQVLIVNLFPRRLRHIGKLSEKWTWTFSQWHSGFQIRNVFHICSISPNVTCLYLVTQLMQSALASIWQLMLNNGSGRQSPATEHHMWMHSWRWLNRTSRGMLHHFGL